MASWNWLWFVSAGFLLGWIASTLVEWLWFRGRRMEFQNRRFVQPESASTRPSDATGRGRMAERAQPPGESASPGESPAQNFVSREEAATRQRVSAPERASQPPTAQPGQRPDNLSAIRGIGDTYQQRLYEAGIFTWQQLVDTDPEKIRTVTKAHPSSDVYDWIGQARELAEKHDRQDATYSGPLPDDLSQIRGIGPAYERQLYEAGIVTYRQLANTTPQQLSRLIPSSVVGEEIDFTAWIDQAAQLIHES